MTTNLKLHFMYEAAKPESKAFAESLILQHGQTDPDQADTLVTVGGDGLQLAALRQARADQAVFSLTPPGSNSHGFWTDHGFKNPQGFCHRLESANELQVSPLIGKVTFLDGTKTVIDAFNDIAIERASGQSLKFDLKSVFPGGEQNIPDIMGDGFIFSTARGSSGTNRSYGGPVVDVKNHVVILTGKGIFKPVGLAPLVNYADGITYRVDFSSVAAKRPVRIDYDGQTLTASDGGAPISQLAVSCDPKKSKTLLTSRNYGERAFAAMMPY